MIVKMHDLDIAENSKTREFALAPGPLDDSIDVQSEEMLVSMGPQHPSTHGVLRMELRTDGEMVLQAVPHLGYLHRCKEKIGENLPYVQFIGYTDRLDYLSAMNNNHAWSMAVEKLAGIEVPMRILVCESIVNYAGGGMKPGDRTRKPEE